MTPDQFGSQAAVVVLAAIAFVGSILFERAPGLRERWAAFEYKREAWLASCFMVVGISALAGANGLTLPWLPTLVLPDPFFMSGLTTYALCVAAMFGAGQATFAVQRRAGWLTDRPTNRFASPGSRGQ